MAEKKSLHSDLYAGKFDAVLILSCRETSRLRVPSFVASAAEEFFVSLTSSVRYSEV